MYEQLEKTKENRARAIANSVVQKKSNAKQGIGFVDNRSHEKLPVIQRMYKFNDVTFTENALYGIKDSKPSVLYTAKTASPPSPDDFFEEKGEEKLEYAMNPFHQYIEQNEETASFENEGGATLKDLSKIFLKYEPKSTFTDAPTKDFEGINDCAAYATALNKNKKRWKQGDHVEHILGPKGLNNLYGGDDYQPGITKYGSKQEWDEDLQGGVGCMYFIQPDPDDAQGFAANHHAATIVAKDAGDRITNEAHVSLPLTVPYFHMYGMDNNNFYERYKASFTKDHNPLPPLLGTYKNDME